MEDRSNEKEEMYPSQVQEEEESIGLVMTIQGENSTMTCWHLA